MASGKRTKCVAPEPPVIIPWGAPPPAHHGGATSSARRTACLAASDCAWGVEGVREGPKG